MSKKITLKGLYDLYTTEHGLSRYQRDTAYTEKLLDKLQKEPLLLEGQPGVLIITSATRGVPLDRETIRPYIHQLLSGEIEAVIFKGYEPAEFSLKIALAHRLEERYHLQISRKMRKEQLQEITGIPADAFFLSLNKTL